MEDASEALDTVVAPRCPFPAGHGSVGGLAEAPVGFAQATPLRQGSPFRAAMGDELGRKAAVGLLFLGSGALVVLGLAVAGWLIMRAVQTKLAERREARRTAPEIGVREVVSSTDRGEGARERVDAR